MLPSETMLPRKPDLSDIAPVLQGLKKDPNAAITYDLFADALIWSDEFPKPEEPCSATVNASCIRGILHFRSSLILGTPKEKFRTKWEEAQRRFPDWPGFSAERQGSHLKDLFCRLREEATNRWEEFEARHAHLDSGKNCGRPDEQKVPVKVST